MHNGSCRVLLATGIKFQSNSHEFLELLEIVKGLDLLDQDSVIFIIFRRIPF